MSLVKNFSFRSRYLLLQKRMSQANVAYLIIEDPLDIFYLTGHHFSVATLIVCADDSADLILDSRYFDAIEKIKKSLCFWSNHLLTPNFWKIFWQSRNFYTVAFNPHQTSYSRWISMQEQVQHTSIKLQPLSGVLEDLQLIKGKQELEAINAASLLACQALDHITSLFIEGVSEIAIAQEIQLFFLKAGAEVAFAPIVAFGSNSASPHHQSSSSTLKVGDIILIDLGAKVDSYCSDMTRTFFFKQKASLELEKVWQLTFNALELARSLAKPGILCSFIDQQVRKYFALHHIEPYFTHSLGHGIGIRVHEAPRFNKTSSDVLEIGSVFTLEPGIYLTGIGGVRLEDTFVITATGAKSTTSYPYINLIN
jgi:Xaa-Pro aminopeptidase